MRLLGQHRADGGQIGWGGLAEPPARYRLLELEELVGEGLGRNRDGLGLLPLATADLFGRGFVGRVPHPLVADPVGVVDDRDVVGATADRSTAAGRREHPAPHEVADDHPVPRLVEVGIGGVGIGADGVHRFVDLGECIAQTASGSDDECGRDLLHYELRFPEAVVAGKDVVDEGGLGENRRDGRGHDGVGPARDGSDEGHERATSIEESLDAALGNVFLGRAASSCLVHAGLDQFMC